MAHTIYYTRWTVFESVWFFVTQTLVWCCRRTSRIMLFFKWIDKHRIGFSHMNFWAQSTLLSRSHFFCATQLRNVGDDDVIELMFCNRVSTILEFANGNKLIPFYPRIMYIWLLNFHENLSTERKIHVYKKATPSKEKKHGELS